MSLEISMSFFFFFRGFKKISPSHKSNSLLYTQSCHIPDTETGEECTSFPHKLCGFEIQFSSPLNPGEHVTYVPNRMAELLMGGIVEGESHIIL